MGIYPLDERSISCSVPSWKWTCEKKDRGFCQRRLNSLRSLLTDSKLFRKNNIFEITTTRDIGKAEEASVYLVFWHDWADDIAQILEKKPDACALIVYAPYEKGRIPDEQMKNLDGKRHTAVTNFRGRLLNDIVTAMITTSYEK